MRVTRPRHKVLYQRPLRRLRIDHRAVVIEIVSSGDEKGDAAIHRTVEFRLRHRSLLKRPVMGKGVGRIESRIAEHGARAAVIMMMARALGFDFDPPLSGSTELGRVGILVDVNALDARHGQFQRIGLDAVHDDLRTVRAGHCRVDKQGRDRKGLGVFARQVPQKVLVNVDRVRVDLRGGRSKKAGADRHLLLHVGDFQADADRRSRSCANLHQRVGLLDALSLHGQHVFAGRQAPKRKVALLIRSGAAFYSRFLPEDLHLRVGYRSASRVFHDARERPCALPPRRQAEQGSE